MDVKLELARIRTLGGERLDSAFLWQLDDLLRGPEGASDPGLWHAARILVVTPDGRRLQELVQELIEADDYDVTKRNPRTAYIAAGLRVAAGTREDHWRRAVQVGEWPSIEAYYDDDPVRKGSPELDFGVHWTEPGKTWPGKTWPNWRVSWVDLAGEVYAVEEYSHRPGRVRLMGLFQTEEEAEAALSGWSDHCGPEGLGWVEQQLAGTLAAYRPDPPWLTTTPEEGRP